MSKKNYPIFNNLGFVISVCLRKKFKYIKEEM
jgi:hypothetical protein